MFNKKTIKDIDLTGKKIVLRIDWDVPADENGEVTDDFRIRASVPTVKYLLEQNCSLVLISKRGRPEGHTEQLSLEKVAKRASEILNWPVKFVDDLLEEKAQQAVGELGPKEIILLQNTRYYPGEASGDEDFAKRLASYGDIYVFDAFAVAHRFETSVIGVSKYLPAVAGLLVEKEITELSKATQNPEHPVLAIAGGAKLETKLPLLENLMSIADQIVVTGVIANILLAAQGHKTGKSVFDAEELPKAKEILEKIKDSQAEFILPKLDVAVAKNLDSTERKELNLEEVVEDDLILDFGKKSIGQVIELINHANTIIWNGPFGYYENPIFAWGSEQVASAIANSSAVSVVGGGDTADVVNNLGLASKFTHVSTGGGASMEFLSGKKLPAIEALLDK